MLSDRYWGTGRKADPRGWGDGVTVAEYDEEYADAARLVDAVFGADWAAVPTTPTRVVASRVAEPEPEPETTEADADAESVAVVDEPAVEAEASAAEGVLNVDAESVAVVDEPAVEAEASAAESVLSVDVESVAVVAEPAVEVDESAAEGVLSVEAEPAPVVDEPMVRDVAASDDVESTSVSGVAEAAVVVEPAGVTRVVASSRETERPATKAPVVVKSRTRGRLVAAGVVALTAVAAVVIVSAGAGRRRPDRVARGRR